MYFLTIKIIKMDKLPEDDFTNEMHVGEQPNTPLQFLTATSMIGDKVYDETGARMGDIKDIMMDVNTGKIHYYVLELGGFLGIGAKYFAIPFDFLTIDPDKKIFIFSQSKEILAKAPGFNRWHWPDTNFHLIRDTSTT
jgi:sporulation protein YlmC with PRC-barrel domain